MPNFDLLKPEYSHMWAACVANASKKKAFDDAAALIKKGEPTYKDLESKTGVPWYLIGMLHYRESDCNFNTHLHNGDSLRYRTRHVPAGRPPTGNPPYTFEYSAIDALKYEGFDKVSDWSIERVLYSLEQYNGWGYRTHGVPSAYVWAGTNQYHSGKYVADGVFSANAIDSQLGCAGIFKVLLDEHIDETDMPRHDDTGIDATHKANGNNDTLNNSRKWNFTVWKQRITLLIASVMAAVQGFDIKGFVHEYGIWLALGLFVAFVIGDEIMKVWMKQDVADGRALPSGGDVTNVAKSA